MAYYASANDANSTVRDIKSKYREKYASSMV